MPKFKVSFYLYFSCFWINVTQINFENIKRKIQRVISDSCFQWKAWFNVDARAPSISPLNFPFKMNHNWAPLSYSSPYEWHLKNKRLLELNKKKIRWIRKVIKKKIQNLLAFRAASYFSVTQWGQKLAEMTWSEATTDVRLRLFSSLISTPSYPY